MDQENYRIVFDFEAMGASVEDLGSNISKTRREQIQESQLDQPQTQVRPTQGQVNRALAPSPSSLNPAVAAATSSYVASKLVGQQQLNQSKQENSALRSRNATMASQLSAVKASLAHTNSVLAATRASNQTLKATISQQRIAIETLRGQIRSLSQQIQQLQRQVRAAKAALISPNPRMGRREKPGPYDRYPGNTQDEGLPETIKPDFGKNNPNLKDLVKARQRRL